MFTYSILLSKYRMWFSWTYFKYKKTTLNTWKNRWKIRIIIFGISKYIFEPEQQILKMVPFIVPIFHINCIQIISKWYFFTLRHSWIFRPCVWKSSSFWIANLQYKICGLTYVPRSLPICELAYQTDWNLSSISINDAHRISS